MFRRPFDYSEPEVRPRSKPDTLYFGVALILLMAAAFLRLWHLGTAPPGLNQQELVNIQLSEQMKSGNLSVIYEEARPAREGLYFGMLAISTALTGKGLILWRLPSVWIAMLSLAMTVTLLRRLFGVRVALLAMGLMAVTFWPVWMGRMVLHITLIPLVATFVLYALMRAYLAKWPLESSLWFTVGGLALGVAQYVHVTAWTLIVWFVCFIVYRALLSRHEIKRHGADALYALSLTLVLMLPLVIFLIRHPGAREPVPVAQQSALLTELPGRIVESIAAIALRGDMLALHNIPGRPVLGPIIAVLMVIGIGVALARWRNPAYGAALLWMIVGLLPTALLPQSADFEYMGVILPVLFVFPALGMAAIFYWLLAVVPSARRDSLVLGLSAVVALLIAGTFVRTYRDYFVIWPKLADVRKGYQADAGILAHYLDTSRDPSPISICTTPVNKDEDPFALTNAELLNILMHRHNLPMRTFNCTQSLVLANGGESQRLIFPRGHYYDHLPGPLMTWIRFAHDEHVPGIGPDVVMRIDVSKQLADVAGSFITTAPTAWPPEAGSELATLPVPFEGNVAFLGYTVRDNSIRSTDWIEMTTYWRLDGPPPPEMRIFAHLLGNPVIVIAQQDGLGAEINTLQVRDVFLQYSMIQTPGGMADGLYPLSVGLYLPSTNRRLNAFENGQPRATRLFLERIQISP